MLIDQTDSIQVLFSIADLDAPNPANETQATQDEAEASEEASAEADEEPSFPVRAAITISKGPGQGGLTVDAVAEDGLFVIDAVAFYGDEKQALDMSAEGDWKRRALYMGPEVGHLRLLAGLESCIMLIFFFASTVRGSRRKFARAL